MARLSIVQDRLKSLSQLLEVVSAMRSLAAARMQQASDALLAARDYAQIVAAGLGRALALAPPSPDRPPRPTRPGLLIFCAEHGFVGGYNEGLLDAARTTPPAALYIIGSRGAALAQERGYSLAWQSPMASQAAGLPALAHRLAEELAPRMKSQQVGGLDVIFGHWQPGGRWRAERRQLLPVPPPAAALTRRPCHYLSVDDLLDRLIEEHLFAGLVCAAAESLACENAARFQAMTAARDNIQRKLETLRGHERVLRQDQITEELLDVVTGANVILAGQWR